MRDSELNVSRWLSCVMCAAFAWSIGSPPASAAETDASDKSPPAIELGAPFADDAILQRQMPVPVWGWSKPGAKVSVALREGDWKIVGDFTMRKFVLFNLADDWKEQHDLSARHPEVFVRLKAKLIAHYKAVRTEGGTMDVPQRGLPAE